MEENKFFDDFQTWFHEDVSSIQEYESKLKSDINYITSGRFGGLKINYEKETCVFYTWIFNNDDYVFNIDLDLYPCFYVGSVLPIDNKIIISIAFDLFDFQEIIFNEGYEPKQVIIYNA